MPGFDTLGARLARSRRRLERERAAAAMTERAAGMEQGSAERGAGAPAAQPGVLAQVIAFRRPNGRI